MGGTNQSILVPGMRFTNQSTLVPGMRGTYQSILVLTLSTLVPGVGAGVREGAGPPRGWLPVAPYPADTHSLCHRYPMPMPPIPYAYAADTLCLRRRHPMPTPPIPLSYAADTPCLPRRYTHSHATDTRPYAAHIHSLYPLPMPPIRYAYPTDIHDPIRIHYATDTLLCRTHR